MQPFDSVIFSIPATGGHHGNQLLRAGSAISLFALQLTLSACGQPAAAQAVAPPRAVVSVIELKPETIRLASEWVATVDGFANAAIRPQVSGYLIKRLYREGATVRQGEVLFEIDARPFEAALAQARAELARAQAELGRAKRDVARDTPLAKERAIAQSQLDNDIQSQLAAEAAVQAAQAAADTATLNLGFTRVHSLIDGVAAIATAQIGDLVGPQTLLTTVSQIEPARANFSLGEREYLVVANKINQARAAGNLWETDSGLTLTLADGSKYPHRGAFLAADRQIDSRTGTIRISATFPNPDRLLRPGQYGRISADTQVLSDALLVPQRAVSTLQGQSQVRVVGTDARVDVKTITLGTRSGNRWIVTQGLEPGARIIMDGPTLPIGTPVTTKQYVAAAATNVQPAPAGKE